MPTSTRNIFRDSPEPIPIEKFEAEGWTDLALGFLRETRRDQRPFFLTVQMGPPHDPYKAPPEFAKLYDPGKLHMRPNWSGGPGIPGTGADCPVLRHGECGRSIRWAAWSLR